MRLDAPLSRLDLLVYGHYRIVHGLRIALAFMLTFLLTRQLQLPESTWPLITLVVVMGPISFWGNVLSRALQRVVGTIFGASCGIVALYLEIYSLPLTLIWCGCIMFLCGYLALGKRPYVGLLIGITLGVTMGAQPGDIHTALWRSGDVVLGSLLALLFCSIYPQRAYSHWRLQLHQILQQSGRLYHTHLSPNVLERPQLKHNLSQLLAQTGKLRALLAPAAKETRHSIALFDAVQVTMRNTLCTLEMLANTYWNDRESHFLMQSTRELHECHQATEEAINQLARMLQTGDGRGAEAAITRLHELATRVNLPANTETAIIGYLWLNVQLTEQLTHLRRLLGLILTVPHRKQPA
ncbi:FUSC family protein [Aeromonas jandaei]|uniref:FUSC family protein n=1 Tax=Aeromonas TaxID=642 RepID=UPI001C5ADA19|nr:FUSC family protein [Aeromonas jandaei]MCF7720239.1 FUSC family protein [Aeromonas jandaei]MCQ4054149.1 FUSC family protein [Aeromonas sp. SG16]